MQELPNLQKMLNAALTQASQECGTLLGQELEMRETSVRPVTRDDYFKGMENASFVLGIESQEDYQGGFCMVLTLKDAIVLSGTLLGIPAPRINEKKKMAIVESDDLDAFSEIANQMIGSFNTVFKKSLPKKAHLKQSPVKKFIPQQDPVEAAEPVADGEYYLLQAQLTLAGTEMEQLDILIPLQLANMFDLREKSNVAVENSNTEAAPLPQSPDETTVVAGENALLILDNNATERQQLQDILVASGVSPVSAALDADLKKLLSHKGLKAVLLCLNNTSDQELAVCLKITANLKGISIPIIMCAREWTRLAVLKALKYGAGDVMMTPSSPDELASKMLTLVNAT